MNTLSCIIARHQLSPRSKRTRSRRYTTKPEVNIDMGLGGHSMLVLVLLSLRFGKRHCLPRPVLLYTYTLINQLPTKYWQVFAARNLCCLSMFASLLFRFITKGREMGADDDHALWEDDAFLDKVQESLQMDGLILQAKRSS